MWGPQFESGPPLEGGPAWVRSDVYRVIATAKTLDQFCELPGHLLGRPVVNKTGIQGKYDFHLEFAIDQSTPKFLPGGPMSELSAQSSDDPAGPPVLTVLQSQRRLKLEAAKGRGDFLVIDRVERPTEN